MKSVILKREMDFLEPRARHTLALIIFGALNKNISLFPALCAEASEPTVEQLCECTLLSGAFFPLGGGKVSDEVGKGPLAAQKLLVGATLRDLPIGQH